MILPQLIELSGALLVGVYVVAQVPQAETSVLTELVKLGSTGVVGAVCIYLIRAREKSDTQNAEAIKSLANAVDVMIGHCSAKNGEVKNGEAPERRT